MQSRNRSGVGLLVTCGLSACNWPIEELEPNDRPEDADELHIGDGGRTGMLTISDLDFFQLQVPEAYEAYKLTLSATDAAGDCFTGVDPYLEVRAGDGTTQLYWVEDSTENFCPTLSFVPEAGTGYYVVVGTLWGGDSYYLLRASEGGTGSISGQVLLAGKSEPGATTGEDRQEAPPSASEVVPGEMLVRAAAFVPILELASRLSRHLGHEVRWVRPLMGGRYQLLSVALPSSDKATARRLTIESIALARSMPGILEVVANLVLRRAGVPDDPLFTQQWALTSGVGINIERAWDLTQGSSETVVAVIDDGHDPTHPDLGGKAVPGFDFVSDQDNAADGDGPDPDPSHAAQSDGHGSQVAGIVAATTDNGIGIAGVGWNTSYMPLRVCGAYGCVESDLLEALWHAAGFATSAGPGLQERRADVANISLSGRDACRPALQDAISAAVRRGVAVVVAAGNDGEDSSLSAPANCADVIVVGGTDIYGVRTVYSNYGAGIHVMAPGDAILTTLYPDRGFGTADGTSFSAPQVSGVAALLKALNPTFSAATVKDLLMGSAHPVDCSGADGGCGAGLIDAAAATANALTRPDDTPERPVLVQALDTHDPSRRFTTVSQSASFTLVGLPAATYQLRAWIDADGDYELNSALERSETADGTFTISCRGEDLSGITLGQ